MMNYSTFYWSFNPTAILDDIKRMVKKETKFPNALAHSQYLEKIAYHAGFGHWNQLYKNYPLMCRDIEWIAYDDQCKLRSKLNKAVVRALPNMAQEYVTGDIRTYLNGAFEKLEDFSYPNPESENGYFFPSIDLKAELLPLYESVYPKELLLNAIKTVEPEGPWCLDDGDIMFEEYGV